MKKIILLASLLVMVSMQLFAQNITAQEASKNIGKTVTICGKIFGGRYFEKNEKTLLNMGGAFPNHELTIVIDGVDRKKFGFKPEEFYTNKEVCVKGEIKEYKGKPELHVTEVDQVTVSEVEKK
jgi:micrococcal nuclease